MRTLISVVALFVLFGADVFGAIGSWPKTTTYTRQFLGATNADAARTALGIVATNSDVLTVNETNSTSVTNLVGRIVTSNNIVVGTIGTNLLSQSAYDALVGGGDGGSGDATLAGDNTWTGTNTFSNGLRINGEEAYITDDGSYYAAGLVEAAGSIRTSTGFYGPMVTNDAGALLVNGVPFVNGGMDASNILTGTIDAARLPNNVKSFGAVGDGVTDDTAAFQSAIASGPVLVPWTGAGYLIGNLIVTNSMIGSDGTPKLIFHPASTGYMLNVWTNHNVQIKNLELDGTNNVSHQNISGLGARHAINAFGYGKNSRLENLWVHGFSGYGVMVDGVGAARNTNALMVFNVAVEDTHTAFYSQELTAEYICFNALRVRGCRYAFTSKAGNQTINGSTINDCYYGINIESGANNGHGNLGQSLVNHCSFPVQIVSASSGYTIVGCSIFGGHIYLASSGNVTITGNTLDVAGYRFESGYRNWIFDNTIGQSYANAVAHNYNGNADATLMWNNYRRDGTTLFGDGSIQLSATGTVLARTNLVVMGSIVATNGVVISSNSAASPPTLSPGDISFRSDAGVPVVVSKDAGGVERTNRLDGVTVDGVISGDGAGLTNFNLLSVAGLGPELKRTESLPLYTHQRLYHTNVARVLFVGDSLTAGSYDRIAAHAFMNTMLAHYGTNGFFGGGNDGKPWVPLSSAGIGFNETTDLWISGLLTVTNGNKQVWKLNAGDGYQTADSAGIVWVKDPAGGTLTVSTISAELVTNTVATIDTAGASGTGGTNITFEAARVMLQVSAASGDCKIAVPGLWHAAGAGVRYGWLGRGGLNNYVTLADANGWWDGLAAYMPDLVVINEIGSSELLEFIRDLQALWPRTDFVIVAPHPVSTDVTSTTELAVRMDWANFARTNRAVTYFDGFELLGGARGYQTLTNIGAIYWNGSAFDGTHMSATNKMVQDILAARLLRELQLAQPSFTRSAYARAVKPIDNGVTLSGNFSGRFTPQTNMVWRTVRDIWTDNGSGSYSYTVPTVWTPVYPNTGPYFRGHLIGEASKYHHVEFGPQDTLGRTNAVFTSYYVTTNATTFPARCAVGVRDIEDVATLTVMLGTAATYTTAPDGTNTHKFVRAVSWSPDVTNAIVNVEVGTGSGTVSNTFMLYGVKAEFY